MFILSVVLNLLLNFAPAKLIIYDGNTAIEHVNNCYRHGIFMRKADFSA